MSSTTPGQVRSLLGDLLQVIEKTSRAYRVIVLHAPGASVWHPHLEGWGELCELAARTASHARELLEGVEAEFGEYALPLAPQSFAQRLNARRTAMHATGIPRPRFH